MTSAQRRALLDEIRKAITDSPLDSAEIARRSGVDKAAISRLLKGAGVSVESIEKLAPVLGLEIIVRAKK